MIHTVNSNPELPVYIVWAIGKEPHPLNPPLHFVAKGNSTRRRLPHYCWSPLSFSFDSIQNSGKVERKRYVCCGMDLTKEACDPRSEVWLLQTKDNTPLTSIAMVRILTTIFVVVDEW